MYNKIAQVSLNSNKTAGASGVFVAQPDAIKEKMAGKIFVLAEIGGKKSDGEKVINFLISELEDSYYNDEKIMLRDKIEGLKVQNIFEAALAKTNKSLSEFLEQEKIRINPETTDLTVGLIYENGLQFASFGKNRALLIYRRTDGFEIINVETDAQAPAERGEEESVPKKIGLFNSVITGEIPLDSYFIFATESLPEYLSGRELVEIITKLPPIVAAEQIKNALLKINSYVPFLGIIIKNTTDSAGQEIKDQDEDNLSAQKSISSLNHTERRTEQMLAPAGIISLKRISKKAKQLMSSLKFTDKSQANRPSWINAPEDASSLALPSTRIEPEKRRLANLPSANSFHHQEKIRLKQQSGQALAHAKGIFVSFLSIFSPAFWKNIFTGARDWFKNLNLKNRGMFIVVIAVVFVLTISIYLTSLNHKKTLAKENFTAKVTEIESKESLIDSHLIYNDFEGAGRVLNDARSLLAALPQTEEYQKADYQRLSDKIGSFEDRIKKITRVDKLEKVSSLANQKAAGIVFAGGKFYAAAGAAVVVFDPAADSVNEIAIEGASALGNGKAYINPTSKETVIFFQDQDKLFKINAKDNSVSSFSLKDYQAADGHSGFSYYGGNLYIADQTSNKIFKYSGNGLSSRADWLKETADVSQTADLFVDGHVYALQSDGSLKHFYVGKSESFGNYPLDPAGKAVKLLGGKDRLYILDKDNKRVVIVSKGDGSLIGQYIFTSLARLDDIAIDDEAKIVYLLSGTEIDKFSF